MLPNVVVGGGIVGLATATALQALDPGRDTVIVEKEQGVALHQTGHNSGVIHSGLYYTPGSLKARLVVQGARDLHAYCAGHDIPFDVPGKLVVATRRQDLAKLDDLLTRGHQNSVPVRRADLDEVAEREPALRVVGALVVESTGRVDYRAVAAALAQDVLARGGTIRYAEPVQQVTTVAGEVRVHTSREVIPAHRVAVCAGLHSDRLARACGIDPGVRILPFRGEYSELVPERAGLVSGLVYPVPDPDLPFLGVHLTRGLDGVVHLGPNAVPALAREGYSWRIFSARDLAGSLLYGGSWRLARRYGEPRPSRRTVVSSTTSSFDAPARCCMCSTPRRRPRPPACPSEPASPKSCSPRSRPGRQPYGCEPDECAASSRAHLSRWWSPQLGCPATYASSSRS